MRIALKYVLYALCVAGLCPSAWAADDHDHVHDHPPAPATPSPARASGSHDDHDHLAPAAHDHGEHDEDSHDHDHGHADGNHADEVTLTPEAIERYGVQVQPAIRQALAAAFTAPGRVAYNAEAIAHVGSVLTGRITQMRVRLGDTVARGDALFEVESPELAAAQSEYLQQRTAVAVAEAAVEPARQAYERARGLHEKSQGIALAEVQKRQAEWQAAQGALATARSALAAAESRLLVMGLDEAVIAALTESGRVSPRSTVRALMDGQVVARDVTLGELVNPDRDALLVLADMRALWVVADVPESRLADVRIGAPAQVQIAALPMRSFEGQVTYIAPALDRETRTAGVRIEVANPDGLLRPGMFARVRLSAAVAADAQAVLAVPETAVQLIEGEPSIFVPVEDEPNTFARRRVKTGPAVGGMIPILDGIEAGQPLVTAGAFILKADLGKRSAHHEH